MVRLYKKDTKGKIRVLHISTRNNKVIRESGVLGGALVTHESECKGKNIGKSNETTPSQQAYLTAERKVTEKLSEGYFKTIEEAEEGEIKLPMLAKNYDDHIKKITFPCFVQPKLDGMRAHGGIRTPLVSRKNKLITTMDHIQDALDTSGLADTIDGELYAHGYTFQENMRLIKKYRKGESEQVKFHVYDVALENLPFSERYIILQMHFKDMENICVVPTYVVDSEEDIKKYHIQFLKDGYEGTIVRWGDAGYKFNGRSENLLKYKDFLDLAAEVVDIEPSEKRPTHAVCVCEYKGQRFKTGMKFSHDEREEMLINKADYIGRTAELRFFEFTDGGIPRFPVCVGFRLDK